MLGCSIGNSKSQLNKARLRLRELLQEAFRSSARNKRELTRRSLALCANIGETSLVPLINEQGEKEKGRDGRQFSWC
jgi:hypothetical protein